jgi:phenylpyruvate tautomerase PptA (4-oxalocrotonate tautomerase family)
MKKAFYKMVSERLHQELGLSKEDIFINLVEVKKENWSFGNGVSQYAQ